jgi:predicted RNA polymerase sigma factor
LPIPLTAARAVLAVVWLIFTESYGTSSGDRLVRKHLGTEATHLRPFQEARYETHGEQCLLDVLAVARTLAVNPRS